MLVAMSPHYALDLIIQHPKLAFMALGAVILCATGAEGPLCRHGTFR